MIVEGNTSHSFKKLMTSAPTLGTIKLSLTDLNVPKLNSMHNIIKPRGRNSLISERLIGQKIFCSCWDMVGLVSSDTIAPLRKY